MERWTDMFKVFLIFFLLPFVVFPETDCQSDRDVSGDSGDTVAIENVVAASSKIINQIIIPQMERQVKTKLDEMEVQLRNDIQVELQSEFDRQMNTAKEEIITKMKQDFNSEKKLMKTELESKIDTKIQTEKPEVLFYAFRNTGGTIGSGSLTFDRAPINIGGSMKPLRGEFEAPVRGIYYFSFSSMTSDQVEGTTGVYIYKNGAQFNVIYESHGNKKYNNLNSSWMMKLERGDQVKMKILQGKLFANVNIHLLWTGHLLKADV